MNESPSDVLTLLFVLSCLLLLFPLLWVSVSATIGYLSGWRSLAAAYRTHAPFEGQRWSFQSGRLRWGMGYRNSLTVGASPSGLHLAVLLPFRVGHPPLFVRWDDITTGSGRLGFLPGCRLDFRAVPGVSVTLGTGLAEKLKAQAGVAWPPGRVEPT